MAPFGKLRVMFEKLVTCNCGLIFVGANRKWHRIFRSRQCGGVTFAHWSQLPYSLYFPPIHPIIAVLIPWYLLGNEPLSHRATCHVPSVL